MREPDNPYDANALRAHMSGVHVGYLARHVAAELASSLDEAGCVSFTVCGVMRGGSAEARDIGVHVWLNRRTTVGPTAPRIELDRSVSWPPSDRERRSCFLE